MTAYYNEFDPFAAQWLRNLIEAGHIAHGVVDDRSILDVEPSDLYGFTQCHFFAGIGGWSLALRMAGVSDSVPLWTGSPPCQPFSVAGTGIGKDDPRHLAPAFLNLIGECKPARIFGEQVANAVKKDNWIDALLIELSEEGYSSGFAVLPAASVGAPHKRDRLFFGAKLLEHARSVGRYEGWFRDNSQDDREQLASAGKVSCVVHSDSERLQGERNDCNSQGWQGSNVRQAGLCNRAGNRARAQPVCSERNCKRLSGPAEGHCTENRRAPAELTGCCDSCNRTFKGDSFWSGADWLGCRDGKFRPVEPGTFPLANGIPARVGRLRGYGNAIVPQAAAEFVKAFMEAD
ncbi:DNA cytosine methyltransferase [Pantoea ananatis]|uniref:DNA cytosine methyltransferase n=1 Tax=Pantoea ananas TaxID=553 RepID=UPI0030B9D167